MLNKHPELLSELEEKAGLNFKNKGLLSQALTHSSYAKRDRGNQSIDNERLEFFGDAVLKLIVSEYLYFKYPHLDEGGLTKKRAQIVSDRLLAELSMNLSVGDYMLFSQGEKGTGGSSRPSNLANAFEALLAAIYLDTGYEEAKSFFISRYDLAPQEAKLELQDSKTVLQEWAQQNGGALPTYTLLKSEGPDHKKKFIVRVTVQAKRGDLSEDGMGVSKKRAEQEAAKRLLERIFK
jgi:ribonuclease III